MFLHGRTGTTTGTYCSLWVVTIQNLSVWGADERATVRPGGEVACAAVALAGAHTAAGGREPAATGADAGSDAKGGQRARIRNAQQRTCIVQSASCDHVSCGRSNHAILRFILSEFQP